ncbi:MAG: hypothetical protein R6W78_06655 [Bacteroidales bacterium]
MKAYRINNFRGFCLAALFVISIALMASCEKDSYNRYGFDSDFGTNSSGLTMMSIGSNVSSIRLSGNIFMDSGEMKVEFINPDGFIIYSRNFFAPGNYSVNETFKASRGIWKLRYTSLEGTGSIDLHSNYR